MLRIYDYLQEEKDKLGEQSDNDQVSNSEIDSDELENNENSIEDIYLK